MHAWVGELLHGCDYAVYAVQHGHWIYYGMYIIGYVTGKACMVRRMHECMATMEPERATRGMFACMPQLITSRSAVAPA